MVDKIRLDFLRKVCILNPSPWDDKRFMLRSPTLKELQEIPEEITWYQDNWSKWLKKYPNQGDLGWCVGWCNALHLESQHFMIDGSIDDLSAEDTYFKARKYDGLPDILGEGSNNLGGMKALNKEGVCLEETRPTNTSSLDSDYSIQKSDEAYMEESCKYGIDAYFQVPVSVGALKAALAGVTLPNAWKGAMTIVTGYRVFESMKEVGDDGIVPTPAPGEFLLGGHSSLYIGYKKIGGKNYFTNLNSWGQDVGDHGFFYWSDEAMASCLMDAWVAHLGAINPDGTEPSFCSVAQGWAGAYNKLNAFRGGKTRLRAIVE